LALAPAVDKAPAHICRCGQPCGFGPCPPLPVPWRLPGGQTCGLTTLQLPHQFFQNWSGPGSESPAFGTLRPCGFSGNLVPSEILAPSLVGWFAAAEQPVFQGARWGGLAGHAPRPHPSHGCASPRRGLQAASACRGEGWHGPRALGRLWEAVSRARSATEGQSLAFGALRPCGSYGNPVPFGILAPSLMGLIASH